MAFSKITSQDFKNKGALSLDDQPTLAPQELKRKFDEDAREVVAPAFNKLVETELPDTSAAANIGAASPTGRTVQNPTVQSVINKVSEDLATLEASAGMAIQDAHTHDNKALLDDYAQSETDLADAVSKKHEHSNKALLDDYTQSDADLADAVLKKHEHSNKALLDDYAQSETDLADAVSKKHSHSNKALLDDYTQTNTDIADAVTKKHTHSNKTVIDKFGEDSGGNPTYDGNPIGGGGTGDAYKTIKVGTTTLTASGADTIEFVADDNIILIPDATTTPKQIKIKSTGGGTGSASWGGISGTLSNQTDLQTALNAKAGTSSLKDLAFIDKDGQSSTKYLQGDGTWQTFPTIPTKVSDLTNDSGYQTASDVSTAIAGKADTSSLKDLAYIDIDGASSTKVLQGDGTWVNPSTGGHTMIPTTNDIATITALQNGNDNYVLNAYSAKRWSNTDSITLLTTVAQGDDTMGTWTDTWETDGDRTGWIKHECLFKVLSDDSVQIDQVFHIEEGENNAIGIYARRIDDEIYDAVTSPSGNPQEQGWYESDGQTPPTYTLTTDTTVVSGKTYYKGMGAGAIKFSAPIETATAKVGFKLTKNRTQLIII